VKSFYQSLSVVARFTFYVCETSAPKKAHTVEVSASQPVGRGLLVVREVRLGGPRNI